MTEFYCCQEMLEFVQLEDFTIKEMEQIVGIRYCPFCGSKLSKL